MKYFVSLFLSLFFLVFMSCGNEDNAWDNNIPIIVFSMDIPGNITKAAKGEEIGTIVRGE